MKYMTEVYKTKLRRVQSINYTRAFSNKIMGKLCSIYGLQKNYETAVSVGFDCCGS